MNVAKGTSAQVIRTVTLSGQSYRELVVPLPANSILGLRPERRLPEISTTSAELFMVNVTGQITELSHLFNTDARRGGWTSPRVGPRPLPRAPALHPLEEVTNEIESVATTNDLQYRLDEGDEDELGRLRRVFNRLLHSVESSQNLQRQLVVDASHELRTPLTSLRTNAQILSRARTSSTDDLHQITDDMITQVDEFASLVTDLGELARGERSEGDFERLRLTTASTNASRRPERTRAFATSPSRSRWSPPTSRSATIG